MYITVFLSVLFHQHEKKMKKISVSSGTQEPHEAFCKIMLGNFSDRLHLPSAFVESFPGVFPSEITLTTRDGRKTNVGSMKLRNKVLLKAGWSDFVQDRSIGFGDFLVFDIVTDSEYNVTIFKRDGCASIIDQKKVTINDVGADSDCTGDETEKLKDNKSAKICRAMQAKTRAAEEADKFASEHPFFKVRMTKAYLKHYHLHIPAAFGNRYLGKDLKYITLQMAESSWIARVALHGRRCVRLGRGWDNFVKDNHLHNDDICVFEFFQGAKIVLKVSIFRFTS